MTETVMVKIVLIACSGFFLIPFFYTARKTILFLKDPENAKIKSTVKMWTGPVALFIAAGLIFFAGLIMQKIVLIICSNILLILIIYTIRKTVLSLKDPEKTEIKSYFKLWIVPIALFIAANLIILVGSIIGKIILIICGITILVICFILAIRKSILLINNTKNEKIESFFKLLIGPIALFIVAALLLLPALFTSVEQAPIGGTVPDAIADKSSVPQVDWRSLTFIDKSMYILLYWFFPGFFIIAGFILIVAGIRTALRMISSLSWKRSKGIIIQSKVIPFDKWYYPEVIYEFQVKDKKYESEIFIFGEKEPRDLYQTRQAIAEYPKGKKLTVYYNPEDPNDCALQPGKIDKGTLLLLFAGGASFLFFGWIVTVALRYGWIKL
jgi:cytochrome c-type biogenesis protein CcmH/NrfF